LIGGCLCLDGRCPWQLRGERAAAWTHKPSRMGGDVAGGKLGWWAEAVKAAASRRTPKAEEPRRWACADMGRPHGRKRDPRAQSGVTVPQVQVFGGG